MLLLTKCEHYITAAEGICSTSPPSKAADKGEVDGSVEASGMQQSASSSNIDSSISSSKMLRAGAGAGGSNKDNVERVRMRINDLEKGVDDVLARLEECKGVAVNVRRARERTERGERLRRTIGRLK